MCLWYFLYWVLILLITGIWAVLWSLWFSMYYLIDRVWTGLKWLLGCDFHSVGEGAQSIVRDVATIYGLNITFAVALTVSLQHGVSDKWRAIILYLVVSVLTLSLMVVILRTKGKPPKDEAQPGHAFDRGSLVFTRFALAFSIAITLIFTLFGILDRLPGQGFDKVTHVESFEEPQTFTYAENKLPGITVTFVVGSKLFPKGIPPKVIVAITLNDALRKDWQVEDVDGYIGGGSSGKLKEMQPPPAPYPTATKDESRSEWVLRDLDSNTTYILKISLQGKHGDAKGDVAKKLIQKENALTVDVKTRE